MVIAVATLVAVVIAAAWTLSPLTVAGGLVLLMICRRAVRDLRGRERGWVIGVLAVAVVARLVVLAGVFLLTDPAREQFHALIPDGQFAIRRSLMLLSLRSGETIGPWFAFRVFDSYDGHAYNVFLAAVQWFSGPSPYALVMISVCAFIAASLLLFSLMRPALGPRPALAGLAVLLFWPTWFVWSVSMLKEAPVLLLSAIVVWGGLRLRDGNQSRLAALAATAAGLAGLYLLRDGVAAIPAIGSAIGLIAVPTLRRSVASVALVAASVLLVIVVATRPSVQALVAAQVRAAASRHIGHVMTVGSGYKVADARFYVGWPEAPGTMQFEEGVRFLIRATAAFVLVPLPWQLQSPAALGFLPEQLAWYALVALALPGVWYGIRRSPQLTMALAGCCVAGVAVIAPNSGNIGTLIRHRDMVVPFLVWLSSAGAERMARG